MSNQHSDAPCQAILHVERLSRYDGHVRFRDNTGNVYFGSYVFRYEDDDRPWPELSAADVGKTNNGESKPAMAKRLSDGVEFRADSVGKLAHFTGVKFATIAYALRTGRQYPCFGYLFKLESDATPWIQ